MKFSKGKLSQKLQLLEFEQKKHFQQDHREEVQAGIFEKKVLKACDEAVSNCIYETLKELSNVYKKTARQDPRVYWTAVKRAILDILKDNDALEKTVGAVVKTLSFGHFSETKFLHLDKEDIVISWIKEFRQVSFLTSASTPEERKELLLPDVAFFLDKEHSESSFFDERYKAMKIAILRASENQATMDLLDHMLTNAPAKRGGVFERWLTKVPLLVVDVSSHDPSLYSAIGFRRAINNDCVATCLHSKWDPTANEFSQWPVLLYENMEELEQLLAAQLYEIFQHHEFSGVPNIII
jgi:hypothetical protein